MDRRRILIWVGGAALAAFLLSGVAKSGCERTAPPAKVSRTLPAAPKRGSRMVESAQAAARAQAEPGGREEGAQPSAADGAPAAPDAWVLQFYSAADAAAFVAAARARGITRVRILPRLNAVQVRGVDPAAWQELLAESPMPLKRVPDYRLVAPPPPPEAPPGATYYAFGPRTLEWLGIDQRPADWGAGVTVAVLDTPVDASHPALTASVVRGGVPAEGVEEPWHGTQMAALIASSGGMVEGIAPGATVLSVPVMSASGEGTSFDLAVGILDAVDQGATVLNVSLGMYGDSPAVEDAVAYAVDAGAVVVASVGNDGTSQVTWPARYDDVLAVAAIDAAGQPMYFSNAGEEIDLAAPGVGLTTAGAEESTLLVSGTSASAAVVSALLAGLLSEIPGLTPAEAAELLIALADDVGVAGEDPETGAGVVNPGRVLEQEQEGIVDVAVGTAHVAAAEGGGGDMRVSVAVQNRGTVPLGTVRLSTMLGDGAGESLLFQSLVPGESVGHTFRVAGSYLAFGPLTVRYEVELLDPVADQRPQNNVGAVTLSLLPSE